MNQRSTTSARMTFYGSYLFLVLAVGVPALPAAPVRGRDAVVIHGDKIAPHWFARTDGVTNQFWYDVDQANDRHEFILVDAVAGRRQPAFDHERVAKALARLTATKVDAGQLPVQSLEFSPDEKQVKLVGLEASWQLSLPEYTVVALTTNPPAENRLPAERAPHPSRASEVATKIKFLNRLGKTVNLFWINNEGKRIAYDSIPAGGSFSQNTYAGHVWLVTTDAGEPMAVFTARRRPGVAVVDGQKPVAPGQTPKREEAPPSAVPSPDGKWEVWVRNDNLVLRELATTNETQLTVNADRHDSYAKNAEADRGVNMDYEAADPVTPIPEVYWAPDSRHFVAMRHRAGTHRLVYLVESSPADQLQPKLVSFPYLKAGDDVPISKPHLFSVATKTEIPVSDALFTNPWTIDYVLWAADSTRFTFQYNQRGHQALRILAVDAVAGRVKPIVNEENRTFIDYSGKYFCDVLAATGEIIWMSERDGWNQLYRYDFKTGAVKNQITKGEWVVRSVDWVDEAKRQIWFQAGGIIPGQDPYYVHFCRVNFDGTGLTVLTAGNGTHEAKFSPDHQFLIDTWSRVDALPVTELRRCSDGQPVCALETATASGKPALAQPFVAKGRDGVTDIYGAIWRPRDFNPHKKYAVIEDIYAGPQDSFTPKAFRASFSQQKLADRGYIVVQLDGMGTANRSKAFHDVCWKNLADAGFPDRIRWIKAAAKAFPGFDLSRVGIYGTSAGGQDALRGLLDHGDFYQAGIADSGCYDNRMDKIWWNEQWMGWPVDDSYARSSCAGAAGTLRGKLLLMAGEMDKNVDPASTMQVVNALVKANKNFELFIMPGMGHGVLSTGYGWQRLEDFFARNLGAPR